MKINGTALELPKEEVIVIPRGGQEIVFKAAMIRDYEGFLALCPEPKLGTRLVAGGKEVSTKDDKKTFQEQLSDWGILKSHWMTAQSLLATEGLEWETIDFQKPETFGNYEEELKGTGFSDYEVMMIVRKVISANGMDITKIDEATESFLAGQVEIPEK